MSRLKTLLNNRITASEFIWGNKYSYASHHADRTDSVYITSQSRIGLRVSLMKQIQWIHQNVKTKHF